ncbi:Zinc finger MYND domain-containing protein 12 [Fasciola gigantica]|uniref:Zinc finger MYND domain-containing protein 12 n=1 Tax=Fasciola gigantica TaxID=46835 RepID=A0A504YKD8_FASGI|nr:Zinc finger MYND domain-containing protein 12 [Fasciola gigantica]
MSLPPHGIPFYPLANPRGIERSCEVCGNPALLQCPLCRVTYYCGTEHQKIDWVGIHEKICNNLMSLRKPVPFIASEDERRKLKDEIRDKNVRMVALTQLVGQKLLFQGKPEEAVPAALQCLKFTADAYGLASVELVSPYLILAESSIGLNRLCQAETYLAQAQWTMLKTQHECSNAIRSQLHRKLGLLYAAKGDYEAALESLAKDIFYASCEFGTDHIRTAGGYFQMAEVFHAMHKREEEHCIEANTKAPYESVGLIGPSAAPKIPGASKHSALEIAKCSTSTQPCNQFHFSDELEIQAPGDKIPLADSLYSRVVDIWAAHLGDIVRSLMYRPVVPEGIGAVVAEITQVDKKTLDEAQKAEAEKMLHAIESYRHERLVARSLGSFAHGLGEPDPKVRLLLALSMLNFVLERRSKAAQYLAEAKVANGFAAPHAQISAEIELMTNALEEVQPSCITTKA